MKRKFLHFSFTVAALFLLTACARLNTAEVNHQNSIGTAWGESIDSSTLGVHVTRASKLGPDDTLVIKYSTKQQTSVLVSTEKMAADRLEFSIVDADLRPLKMYRDYEGNLSFQGNEGQQYKLLIRNLSQYSYEIVATVDGLDVINGQPGSFNHGGYIVRGGKTLVIDGFRKNSDSVAAFRFSKSQDAYASNTRAGDPNNIGVIGIAAFLLKQEETNLYSQKAVPVQSQIKPKAFPAESSNQFAPAPNRY